MEWTPKAIWDELSRMEIPKTTFLDQESLPAYAVRLEDQTRIIPDFTRVGRSFETVDEASIDNQGRRLRLIATVKWDGAADVEAARRERQIAKKEKRTWLTESERRAAELYREDGERRAA